MRRDPAPLSRSVGNSLANHSPIGQPAIKSPHAAGIHHHQPCGQRRIDDVIVNDQVHMAFDVGEIHVRGPIGQQQCDAEHAAEAHTAGRIPATDQ